MAGLAASPGEQERTEAERQAREHGFGTLIESLNAGAFHSLVSGQILYVNQGLARIAGYDRAEDVLALHASALYAPGERERMLRALEREGTIQDFDLLGVRKDGTSCWISMNAVRRESPGEPPSVVGILQDITHRKQVEQALAESEERFRAIIEKSPISMAIVGLDGAIEYINQKAVETFGYQPEDIPTMERWWVQAYPDEAYRQWVISTWEGLTAQAIAEQHEIQGREYRVTCKDGTVKTVFIFGVPVANKVFVMFQDITERKQAEESLAHKQDQLEELNRSLEERVHERTQALQKSHDQLASFSRLLPGVLYQFHRTTDGRVTVPYMSEVSREVFELAPEAVLDDAGLVFRRVHEEDLPPLLASIEESARKLEPWHFEFRIVLPEKGLRWCLADSRPERQEDGSILWHGFISDATERKRVEKALQEAKDAAEAATRAKSQFLANVSHEIRTPMNAIIGFTDLVLESDLGEEQRSYLHLVQKCSNQLLLLIHDILDLSKIEADRLELDLEPLSPVASVGEVQQMFALSTNSRGIDLKVSVADDVPEVIVGDPRRLRQVLVNLVGNAVKFTDRGEICVSVDVREAEGGEGERCLHFTVRDTGVGIPPDQQRLVFEAFSQANATYSRRHAGVGLGLTIARRLLEMMGGRIWVESEAGVGSTFHFTIPMGLQDGGAAAGSARNAGWVDS